MAKREIDRTVPARDEDWEGNNAVFSCPKCGKVFVVGGMLHQQGRAYPGCGKATGFVNGGRQSSGSAYIEW
jgi:predicted RNA-binding Zn-ribbon protein involved in translation (DUF1610 family)